MQLFAAVLLTAAAMAHVHVYVYAQLAPVAPEAPPLLLEGTVEHLPGVPLGLATLHPRFSWSVVAGAPRNVRQREYTLQVRTASGATVCSSSCGQGEGEVIGAWQGEGEVARPGGCDASASSLVAACGATAAAALTPGQVYCWQVDTVLSDGTSATMPPQWFSTGLQTRADWHPAAQFIGLPANHTQRVGAGDAAGAGATQVVCPWLRSAAFDVTSGALATLGFLSNGNDGVRSGGSASAVLTVASIGWHEVYLNGHRLEEASVLIPSVSDMHHRVLSHQYDTGGYLVAGSNVLAFWAAPGWSQLTWPSARGSGAGTSFNVSAAPLVMAQLTLCGADESEGAGCFLLVATNATGWNARPSSIEHTGSWNWGNYGGEKLDWGHDLADWSTTASSIGWVPAAAVMVDKAVTPESLEAMAVVETLPATGIAPCNGKATGSCFVVSFPKLFNGFFAASSLPGVTSGQAVTFTYSANCLSPCPPATAYMPCAPPTSGPGVCTSAAPEWAAVDTVVAGADSTGFANKFNWHTFQFVVIEVAGGNGTLALGSEDLGMFTGGRITNAQARTGAFTSSSPMLNNIYDAFVQTYESLTVSGMQVDCTNRERLGYGGDAHSRIEFAMDSYSSHALYSKWLTDWRDTQLQGPVDDKENPHVFGNVPNTAPTYSGAGSPMWGGITVLLPYELYRRYGDMRMLQASYPAMRDFLNFMVHFAANTTDGLVHPKGFDWLGDWQAPHGCSDGNDPDLYNNAYIVYALKRAVEVIAAINNNVIAPASDGAKFEAAALRIGAGVHSVFFRTEDGCYGPTSPASAVPRQGHQVLALAAEVTPAGLVPGVMASLIDKLTNVSGAANGHIDTGLTTTYFMGKLLSGGMEGLLGGGADRPDLIYRSAMNPTWPSYAALITAGLSTWPETWSIGNVAGGVSKMHGTLNGFGLTFPQSFLGVTQPFGSLASSTPGSGLQIRPSYFISGTDSPPPPPPPPPPPAPAPAPAPSAIPCLGGIVAECGSSVTGACTQDRDLRITCKTGTGVITGVTFASWGTPTGTCGAGFRYASSCNDTRAYSVAVAACVGKKSCSITPSAFCSSAPRASSSTDPRCPFAGEDPCKGQPKKLAVMATGCTPANPAPPPPPPPPAPPTRTIPPLVSVRGAVRTLHGVVNVSWADGGTRAPVFLNVSVPVGARNTSVWVVGKAATVTESGMPVAGAQGVRLLREATRRGEVYSVWVIGSGSYTFSSHR